MAIQINNKAATPKRLTATITATIIAPADCSEIQFESWIMQEMGVIPTDTGNPLLFSDLNGNVKDLDIKVKK
jgi:hypothetical protein